MNWPKSRNRRNKTYKRSAASEKTGAVLFFGKKTKTYKKESKIEKIRDNLKIYHNLQV